MCPRNVASGSANPLPSENPVPLDLEADAAVLCLDAKWTNLVHAALPAEISTGR